MMAIEIPKTGLAIVKVYRRSTIMYTELGVGVIRGSNIRDLGVRIINSLFVKLGFPFAVLPRIGADGRQGNVKDTESFYLVTECGIVVTKAANGFFIYKGPESTYCVTSADLPGTGLAVDSQGITYADEDFCKNVLQF
jgi:hypothetical protein